jgi:tetratricopeptide (TPR) repeat protein
MADPLKSANRPNPVPEGAEDEARIEQLLVQGLDHYFAGEFEPAINLWTRVLFLDRNHDRARAYIDRARSAQAETQRASEALVHEGLAAFDRGDVGRARDLLRDAIDRGASHDLALGVLGRIDRLDVQAPAPAAPVRKGMRGRLPLPRRPIVTPETASRHKRGLSIFGLVLLAAAIGSAVWFSPEISTFLSLATSSGRPSTMPVAVAPLVVPAPYERHLADARALYAGGRLRDALRALDRVPFGDAERAEADRLRGEIQRELLASLAVDSPPPGSTP